MRLLSHNLLERIQSSYNTNHDTFIVGRISDFHNIFGSSSYERDLCYSYYSMKLLKKGPGTERLFCLSCCSSLWLPDLIKRMVSVRLSLCMLYYFCNFFTSFS